MVDNDEQPLPDRMLRQTLREESKALAAARAKGLNDPPASIDGAFTPTGAAKMLVTIYGHKNWKPTGLEEMALLVARTFLAQQPDPRETIPHYGHGKQETANG